jgi:hypothetical protein
LRRRPFDREIKFAVRRIERGLERSNPNIPERNYSRSSQTK